MGIFRKNLPNVEYFDINDTQEWLITTPLIQNFVISVALKINHTLDNDTLLKAINMEIQRNEALRLRCKKVDGKWKQYFLPPFELKSVVHFDMRDKTIGEVEKAVDKQSDKKILFNRSHEPFRFTHFMGPDNTDYLLLQFLHIYTDAYTTNLTLIDTLNVYLALIGAAEMPQPLTSTSEYLKNSVVPNLEAKVEKATRYFEECFEQYGEPQYAALNKSFFDPQKDGHVLKPLPKLNKQASMLRIDAERAFIEKVNSFCAEHRISQNALYMLAFRSYYSAANDGCKDIFFYQTIDNRSKAAEKRLPCSISQVVMVRTVIDNNTSFSEALKETDYRCLMALRHRFYPLTKYLAYAVEHYAFPANGSYYDLAYGRIAIDWSFPSGWIVDGYWPSPETITDLTPIYLMILDSTRGARFCYRYTKERYTENDLIAFHNGMVKIIERGMEDPSLTLNELMKELQ